jgi:hypothetical protein
LLEAHRVRRGLYPLDDGVRAAVEEGVAGSERLVAVALP